MLKIMKENYNYVGARIKNKTQNNEKWHFPDGSLFLQRRNKLHLHHFRIHLQLCHSLSEKCILNEIDDLLVIYY